MAKDTASVNVSPTDRVIQAHGYAVRRVGKHAAGRLLDGRDWSEMPRLEVPHA